MIYNIAVFGSCASRDNFYSGINPDYKKYFNCSISSQRGSIISLMQEPVPFKNQDIQILPENRVNKAGTQFINQDLTKNFLAEVKKFKPDYILIDNYFEVIFGIIKYENCFITNNYWDLPKTKFHTEIKPYTKINMYNDPNTYLKLYKENMNLFLDYIQKESPNSQIILNPVRLGYKILKDDNNIEVNKNLEEQLSLLFNDWFVNCTPFKNEELIKSEWGVVPESWNDIEFGELIEITSGNRPDEKSEDKTSEFNIPLFGASKIMGYTKEYSYNEDILIIGRVGTHGVVQRVNYPCFPSDNTFVIKSDYYGFVYQLLKRIDYDSLNTGSTQPLITQKSLKTVNAVLPDEKILSKFEMISKTIFDKIQLNNDEISKLTKLRDTLLHKLMSGEIDVSKINCDLELKYNYMKYLFNQIHTPMFKSVV